MTRAEINEMFNEYVLRNAPKACSLTAIKALSRIADLKMKLDKVPYAGAQQAAKMIIEEKEALYAILPKKRNVPGVDFAFKLEEQKITLLINICNGLQT
jgi:hypothetical protein